MYAMAGIHIGSLCFLRVTLEHDENMPTINRGGSGTVEEILDDGFAAVRFSPRSSLLIKIKMLEPYPGTLSRGFAALTLVPHGIYTTGMMCSDINFPTPHQAQYTRYVLHREFLLNSGTGVSFFHGIDALAVRRSFHTGWPRNASAYLNKLGLRCPLHAILSGFYDK